MNSITLALLIWNALLTLYFIAFAVHQMRENREAGFYQRYVDEQLVILARRSIAGDREEDDADWWKRQ